MALVSMVGLLKGRASWVQFVDLVGGIRDVFATNQDPGMHIGGQVLVKFVLHALARNPLFSTDVAYLKRLKNPSLEHVMSQLNAVARGDELRVGGARPLSGLHASAEADLQVQEQTEAGPHASEARVKGAGGARGKPRRRVPQPCHQFASTGSCSYGENCRFEHRPPTGGCAECGGPHDVSRCPAKVKRLEARIAQLEARGVADPELVAQLQQP